ncbi:alpha-amylase family glycosyl hydrolase [Natronoarchaeum rubrum]|uniref:alpha-amylase family glycosyl hydrolase n=1 Tax=Natronoarchaeum rubrum TaxID=755311 RepID=UPI002111EA81|nr:alpha-amylase family glycosyl hydrolase [Natronoarchaeum rubrum]
MQRRTFLASLSAVAGAASVGVPASAEHDANKSELDLVSGDGSHHPGPPRFTRVGEGFVNPNGNEGETRNDLAPWNPDGDAEYSWSVVDAPADATTEPTDAPVAEFEPDAPGEYTLALDAPDGTHELTVRVFDRENANDARPRIDLDADVEGDRVMLSATTEIVEDADTSPDDLDVEFYVDDRDSLSLDEGPAVPADLDEPVRVHAVAVGERHSVADAIDIVPGDDGVSIEYPYEPPEYAKNGVIYEIFTRRFPDEDDRSFDNIASHLDHVEELGADVLWMTPFVSTDRGYGTPESQGGPHGYHTTDYFEVDPDLGTMEDLEALVDAAHERDIRVVFDLVINHTADTHPFFQTANRTGREGHEKYKDWYRWDDFETRDADTYFGWSAIPNLNHENPEVRQFLLDVVDFWVEKVDGFRCDVAWGVPMSFWKEIYDRIKSHDSEFYLLDESWPYDVDQGEGQFDVHYDDALMEALEAAPNDAEGILDAVEERRYRGAHPDSVFMQWAENHDTDRYKARTSRSASMAAGAATCTLPGVPTIYAGQETGLDGYRDWMNWGDFDEELFAHYKNLVELRQNHAALQTDAELERIEYGANADDIVAYARHDPESGERVVVALNFGTSARNVRLGDYVETTDLITGEDADVESGDGHTDVTVDHAVVLSAAESADESADQSLAAPPEPSGGDSIPGFGVAAGAAGAAGAGGAAARLADRGSESGDDSDDDAA